MGNLGVVVNAFVGAPVSKLKWAALVILIPIVVAIVLAGTRGALAIPRDDDWSYVNVALDWAQTGEFLQNGWVHMMFVGQGLAGVQVAGAFGSSVVGLQVVSALTGVAGLVAVYSLASRILSRWGGLLVVFLTGFSPLWLHLTPTFMTDVPAWSLSAVAFALGVRALTAGGQFWLISAGVVGFLAFGIREYAVVPLFALLLWVGIGSYPKRLRWWALGLGLVLAGTCSAMFVWRQALPGSVETSPLSFLESLSLFSRLLLAAALLLAPYLVLSIIFVTVRGAGLAFGITKYWVGAFLGIFVAIAVASLASWQVLGNVIHPYGSSWTSVGDGVRSLPLWGFRSVTLLAVMSLVVLMASAGMLFQRRVLARSWRLLERPQPSSNLAGLYVFVSASVMAAYFFAILFVGAPAFDRYLLLVIPLIGIVIMWLATRFKNERLSKWQEAAVAGVLVVTGAFGFIITDGLNQVDGLRWQVASKLVESGIPAYKIDGGDAWFRFHQKDAPGVAQVGSLENEIPGRTWWQTFFEGSTFCRMVAIESETDLQAMYGPALSIREERTLLGTPFRIMVFPGPDPC
jgi:hypothetical protein